MTEKKYDETVFMRKDGDKYLVGIYYKENLDVNVNGGNISIKEKDVREFFDEEKSNSDFIEKAMQYYDELNQKLKENQNKIFAKNKINSYGSAVFKHRTFGRKY